VPDDLLSQLAYDSAIRALDLQERGVEQLRARTGTLLAASSLTASFLGALAIQHSATFGVLNALGLVAMTCSIALCVYVLLPKKGFVFSLSGPAVYEELFEFREDNSEIHRRLVYWQESYWEANQAKIDELGRFYLAAALGLLIQLVLWVSSLGATLS
jgi:hypothetical protein